MPCMIIHRNFTIEKDTIGVLQDRFCAIVEKVLHKPKSYIMVIVDDQRPIRFGGSDEPALFIELKSIGLPGDTPSLLSRELCSVCEELLSVSMDRIYIEFSDSPRNLWGWNGGTF